MEPSNTRRITWNQPQNPGSINCPIFHSYETGNGIKLEGSGFTKKAVVPQFDDAGVRLADTETDVLVQVGSYSYTAPDGQVITVKYIADENGFQPQGDHIPTPPNVPEAIVQSLNQQANAQQQQQQQQSAFAGQPQGRANSNVLQSPQSSKFVATTPVYPLDKHGDKFAEFKAANPSDTTL